MTDPANPDLAPRARAVLSYLHDLEGDAWLAGQEEGNDDLAREQARIEAATGHRPALRGFESANYSTDPIPEAIRSFERGQFVTLGYHAGAPPRDDSRFAHSQAEASVRACLDPDTEEGAVFHSKLAAMADRLETLRDRDVPVLWRPFHEMNGDWFWWSGDGPAAYRELWRETFEYFIEERALDNLLWVWAASYEPDPAWYPGDDYVDVVGTDTYRQQRDDFEWADLAADLREIAPDKPVVLAETDAVPDPDDVATQDPAWTWFLPWHGEHVGVNDEAYLRAVYEHPYTVTADDLPEW